MVKRILITLGCFIAAILVTSLSHVLFDDGSFPLSLSCGKFDQKIIAVNTKEEEVNRLYADGVFLGNITSMDKLNNHLKEVYKDKYEDDFPGSGVHLGRNTYVVSEPGYFSYSDVDDQLLQYLDDNEDYTLETNAVIFSDDSGEYAEIYVTDTKLYEEAMNEYLSFFIDGTKSLAALEKNQDQSTLTDYGSKDVSLTVSQKISYQKKNASPSEIRRTREEILNYLEYGDTTQKEYYTVQKYDTVAGVGAKNHGLSANQVMNINRDQISSVDQVLKEGEQLCVTYFRSPIDVVVSRQALRKEAVYFKTEYQEDETMLVNTSQVVQDGINGSRNALYNEKWVNGILVSGSLKSSIDIQQPVKEIVKIGTMQPKDVGTGSFRYPVDNAYITCPWGCYYNHTGTDFINQYERWGNAIAADNGVVKEISYNSVSGNYIKIDHNNGYVTYYGHLREPSPLKVGDVVQKGDVIGRIGMTGFATGPHVHFYIEENGQKENACEVSIFPSCKEIGGD